VAIEAAYPAQVASLVACSADRYRDRGAVAIRRELGGHAASAAKHVGLGR
jgi:hypothetical protein